MLRDKLNSKIEILRNTSRQFIKMFKRNCMPLEEVRIQLIKLNTIDLRLRDSFLVSDDLSETVCENKCTILKYNVENLKRRNI